MMFITTNHYSMHKHTNHKKVMIFFFKFKEHKAFKQSKKRLIWRKKKLILQAPYLSFCLWNTLKVREKILFKKSLAFKNIWL